MLLGPSTVRHGGLGTFAQDFIPQGTLSLWYSGRPIHYRTAWHYRETGQHTHCITMMRGFHGIVTDGLSLSFCFVCSFVLLVHQLHG